MPAARSIHAGVIRMERVGKSSEKSGAYQVAQPNSRGNTEDAKRGGFAEQRANDERPICAQRFQNSDVAGALDHGGVHGKKNNQQPDGYRQADHGVNKRL